MSPLPEELLRSVARLVGASWAWLASDTSRFVVRERGSPRDVDAGLLRSVERGRLVRVGRNRLRRWPRAVSSELGEVIAYVHRDRPKDRVVLGLQKPLEVDGAALEKILGALLERESSDETGNEALMDACIVHDLRHLLTVVSLELERARSEPEGTALERVRAALGDARRLCERPLLEARAPRLRVRPLLESAAKAASLASGRSGRVTVRVGGDEGPELEIDPELLLRAVRNLVLNAIEATPDGGSVSVDLDAGPAGEIRISVRDQGRGIAAEDLPDLLRPGRTASGGSGFGTASVRACVRELGGRLEVRSRPREGTEFVLRLPRGTSAAALGGS